MPITLRMPDERLTGFVDSYGHWPVAMQDIDTFAPGLIAFNLQGALLEVDGERRMEPVLMGIANDPMMIRYSIKGPGIVTLRCRTSAFDRLFHIDPSQENGVVAMDPDKHPRIAAIHEHLVTANPREEDWFAALDAALVDLLPTVKPWGLAGRFVDLTMEKGPDLSVAEVAEILECSTRTLERACQKRFGRSPKRLLRGQRLGRALELERGTEDRIELAADFAYADLPHYLNEIRRITGRSRKQYQKFMSGDNAFPHRYEWPDGQAASNEEEIAAWKAESARRYRSSPG